MTSLVPNPDVMMAHLDHLFGGDLGGFADGLIELAWTDFSDKKLRHARLFGTDQFEELIAQAVKENSVTGQNLYIGAALRQPNTPRHRRSTDQDFFALPSHYVDLDERGVFENVQIILKAKGAQPTAQVITGRHPYVRGQCWWRLETPETGPEIVRQQNRALADALRGDVSVVNPGRVMRLAGSIAWPVKSGRVTELTEFLSFKDARPSVYFPGQLAKSFPFEKYPPINQKDLSGSKAKPGSAALPMDIEEALSKAVSGNWHNTMLHVTWRLVAQGWSDDQIFKLCERHTLPGWTVQQTKKDLRVLIDGARKKGPISTKRDYLIDGIAPIYPGQPLERDQAIQQLQETVGRWFDVAAHFAMAHRELKAFRPSAYSLEPPKKQRALFKKELETKHDVPLKAGPRFAIQAAAGLGKTTFVVNEIMRRPELWKLHIWIFVPTLDLAERLATQFSGGPHVRVMRGRLAKAMEPREREEPKSMCRKPDAAELAGKLGINVFKTLCKSGAGFCDYYDQCPWIAQWDDREPGIRIWSHDYLHLPKLPRTPKPDLVIVDETIVDALTGETQFSPDRLTETPSWVLETETAIRLKHIKEILESDEPELKALRERGITKDALLASASEIFGGQDGDTGVTPLMSEPAAVAKLHDFEESERGKLSKLLSQLAQEIELERDRSHAVFFRRNVLVNVDGKLERQNRMAVHWRKKVLVKKITPILLIDADADAEISKRFFGDALKHVIIPVDRNAHVTQCYSSAFSRQSFIGFKGDSPRSKKYAAERLEKLKALIKRESQTKRLLVVCSLSTRRKITGEDAPRLPIATEWEGATISHFGRIRGVDDWKNHESVMIVGREQMPPAAAEAMARAIWCDDPTPLNLPGKYEKAPRGYRLRNGRQVGVEVDVHQDARVQRILELKRERESAQAIDRLRLVHAEEMKSVIIVSKVPLDISVDELVSWPELTGGGTRLRRAWVRSGGALPLIPTWIASQYSDLFETPEAAKKAVQREFLVGTFSKKDKDFGGDKSQIYINWLLSLPKFRPLETGRGGHRSWSQALLAADTPFFRSRIRDHLSCPVIWDTPPSGKIFDLTVRGIV